MNPVFLQLRSVRSTFSRWEPGSPAAQRGSTLSLRSPGPPSLRLTTPSRSNPQSSWRSSSSTTSAVLWRSQTLIWTTAAPSAPAEARRKSLCLKQVSVSERTHRSWSTPDTLSLLFLSFQLQWMVQKLKQQSPARPPTVHTQASSGGSTTVRSSWAGPGPTALKLSQRSGGSRWRECLSQAASH